jgi:hypothetical protein
MSSDAKRAAIAEHEQAFGKPGAFGSPGSIEEKLPEMAARAEFRSPGLRKELLSFADNLVKRISNQGFRLGEIPVDFAHVIKQDFQALARKGGAYAGKEIEDAFTKVMADAAMQTRQAVIDAMPASIRSNFADVMGKYEGKTKFAQAILNKAKDTAATEDWLRDVYGSSNSSGMRYLQQLEDHFGTKLLPDVAEAQAAEIIGKGNLQNFAEKHPYMAAAAIFHPQTALPAILGLGAGPKVGGALAAAGRGVGKATEAVAEGAGRAMTPEAKAAAVRVLQAEAAKSGKGITSENQASVASRGPKRVTRLF